MRGKPLAQQGDEVRIERTGFFLAVQHPHFHHHDVGIGTACAFQVGQQPQAGHEAVELHIVVIEVGVDREADVGRHDSLAAFGSNLEGGDVIGGQTGDIGPIATGGADGRHARLDEGLLAIGAGVHHGRTVVVHPDVAQQLMALGTTELPAKVISMFRRYIGTAEVMNDLLALNVRAVAMRTVLYI